MTTIEDVNEAPAVEHRQVWDLPVRVFHWTLVLSIIGAFVTNRLGVSYFKYHVWFGYTVIVLVLFRVVWGVVGTRHAQFWNFVCSPAETLRYAIGLLRGHRLHYAGHNPLGAWMVLALLIALGAQASFGLFANDEIFNVGPLYGYVSKELSLQLTSLHRHLFYWIMGAVAVHVLAVIAHHVFEQANLVHAMITGRKPRHIVAETDGIGSSRTWLAVLLIVALAWALAWVVNHASAPVDDGLY
ncbi:cytochrome b/b6 domain-containing protein [Methylocapsa polymorpha]|uniref:Cytochrome b/b6 domain-containing protein n=1 Tax=Methylocapsa polymorpha TaxID=3080828 RepID=A0ABZ0HWE2_9HYPH|nr:cytochrome b/b6 domain-containing protein [Methylocapsa sp. RX1]